MLANGARADRVHLAHDMTFYLPADHFSQFQSKGAGTFYCLRQDGERTDDDTHPDNVDLSLSWNGGWWTNERLCRMSTHSLAAAIAPFARVVTDRLHLAILSAMLGKEVLMGANNYYKNKAVYEHSLQPRLGNVKFYDSRGELLTAAA
jgi:exopolysaccharide biosynthesis predicted pyruvyltransferase EpsI